jgi:hypothetical protein
VRIAFRSVDMSKLAASAMFCAGLMLFTAQAHAQHRVHSKVAAARGEFVRLTEVCAFGFWCGGGMLNDDGPAPSRPLVAPKAKLARGIDRDRFRVEIAKDPELIEKMTHMVFGEVGRQAPLPVKIIQLETAFNRAQARGQTLAHVLLSVKESPADGYYAVDTYSAEAQPTAEEVETFKNTVLAAVLHGSNLSDVGYGPMTGNASAGVAAHQFAKGDPGYQLQAGDAYFREGPFTNDFPEISPSAVAGLGLDDNKSSSVAALGPPVCKSSNAPSQRYCAASGGR